jgi:16S rRNA U1498 N3-methylase RsmE
MLLLTSLAREAALSAPLGPTILREETAVVAAVAVGTALL